jgi:hypothetical protein
VRLRPLVPLAHPGLTPRSSTADELGTSILQRRAMLLIVLTVFLLVAFTALALWGPEEPSCVNVIDHCDNFGSGAT